MIKNKTTIEKIPICIFDEPFDYYYQLTLPKSKHIKGKPLSYCVLTDIPMDFRENREFIANLKFFLDFDYLHVNTYHSFKFFYGDEYYYPQYHTKNMIQFSRDLHQNLFAEFECIIWIIELNSDIDSKELDTLFKTLKRKKIRMLVLGVGNVNEMVIDEQLFDAYCNIDLFIIDEKDMMSFNIHQHLPVIYHLDDLGLVYETEKGENLVNQNISYLRHEENIIFSPHVDLRNDVKVGVEFENDMYEVNIIESHKKINLDDSKVIEMIVNAQLHISEKLLTIYKEHRICLKQYFSVINKPLKKILSYMNTKDNSNVQKDIKAVSQYVGGGKHEKK